jgi:hypothetical protein
MAALKPIPLLALGSLLMGVTMGAMSLVFSAGERGLRAAVIGIANGLVFGLVVFAPIAFAGGFRVGICAWRQRHPRIEAAIFVAMMLSLGYLIACQWHSVSDAVTIIAVGVVFLGAIWGMIEDEAKRA